MEFWLFRMEIQDLKVEALTAHFGLYRYVTRTNERAQLGSKNETLVRVT